MSGDLETLVGEEFCYLTTTGRVTGRPHEIEIWFSLVPERHTLFMMAGGRDGSDWVKNLKRASEVEIRIADRTFIGEARIIEGESDEPLARRSLVEKYERTPGSLAHWGRESLPVSVNLRSRDVT